MKKIQLALAAVSVILLASCTKSIKEDATFSNDLSATSASTLASEQNTDKFVPNELLVKFKPGISETKKQEAFNKIGGNVSQRILTKTMQRFGDNEGVYLLHTPLAALEAISKVKGI